MIRSFALCAVVACASLRAPEQPRQGRQKQGITQSDKRGANDSPLVIRRDSAEREQEAADRRSERKGFSAFEDRSVDLAYVMAALALAQALLFFWQLRKMNAQMRLAHDEFTATHRPRVVLRRVTFGKPSHQEAERPKAAPIFKIEVANIGDGRARVNSFALAFAFTNHEMPTAHELLTELEKPKAQGFGLGNGDSHVFEGPLGPPSAAVFWSEQVQRGIAKMFVAGYVEYADDNGRGRRTGFIRRCNILTQRFDAVNDPDFEYQD